MRKATQTIFLIADIFNDFNFSFFFNIRNKSQTEYSQYVCCVFHILPRHIFRKCFRFLILVTPCTTPHYIFTDSTNRPCSVMLKIISKHFSYELKLNSFALTLSTSLTRYWFFRFPTTFPYKTKTFLSAFSFFSVSQICVQIIYLPNMWCIYGWMYCILYICGFPYTPTTDGFLLNTPWNEIEVSVTNVLFFVFISNILLFIMFRLDMPSLLRSIFDLSNHVVFRVM